MIKVVLMESLGISASSPPARASRDDPSSRNETAWTLHRGGELDLQLHSAEKMHHIG